MNGSVTAKEPFCLERTFSCAFVDDIDVSKDTCMEHNTMLQQFKEPFRFQTPQQKSLHAKLRLLGPGPATFYREACILMMPPQQFESTTHLVAHLLREIESSVRRVLLPYDYEPPDTCEMCSNRPEAHTK